jgi:DNA primase
VLALPDGADPDEFLRAHGAEEYNRRRGEALPHIQFVIGQALRDHNIHNPPEKGAAVKEVFPFIRAVRDKIQRREYFDIAVGALQIEDSELIKELWKEVSGREDKNPVDIVEKVTQSKSAAPTRAEERLLELLIHDGELRQVILPRIEPADYETLATAHLFNALIELSEEGVSVDFDTLRAKVAGDPISENVLPLLMMAELERDEGEAIDTVLVEAEGCLSALQQVKIDRLYKAIGAKIEAAEKAGDFELVNKLFNERTELKRSISSFIWTKQK